MGKGVWAAIVIWAAFVAAAGFTFTVLREHGVISGNTAQVLALTLAVLFSATCLVQAFLSYEVTTDAL
jgi:hypothetical protein